MNPLSNNNEMLGYEHMTNYERKQVQRLQKRLNYLQDRISKSPVDLSYDKAEASALSWVLEYIAKEAIQNEEMR